jgi:DNA-binding transcriptional regulator YiaG
MAKAKTKPRGDSLITGDTIKRVRASLGESQDAFCARLGIDQGTLSRWEAGRFPRGGMGQKLLERVIGEISRVHP